SCSRAPRARGGSSAATPAGTSSSATRARPPPETSVLDLTVVEATDRGKGLVLPCPGRNDERRRPQLGTAEQPAVQEGPLRALDLRSRLEPENELPPVAEEDRVHEVGRDVRHVGPRDGACPAREAVLAHLRDRARPNELCD